ncbi:DNA-methyltransferase [Streptomyces varsoviensis]|nr:DNA methyltransferase [Streptomyces varsoviensis]
MSARTETGSTVRTVAATAAGTLTQGDATAFLRSLPAAGARLVVTSPWFTGPYEPSSDDPTNPAFGDWLDGYMAEFARVLRPDGSVVIETGCSWARDRPVRTVQNLAAISRLLARGDWHLLQEFYWYNPELLDARDEWVTEGRIRLHDCVTTWFWLARTPDVPVDTRRVRGFQNYLTQPFGNFLTMGDSAADYPYLDGVPERLSRADADRFPVAAPLYFIRLLTEEGERVVDPFCGIGSTALAAESAGREWSCNDFSAEAIDIAKQRIDSLRK